MKRTISAMVGKGSVNHNQRKFTAENVDKSRSHLNMVYYSDKIEDVYHQLFDEALKRYNEKQTRNDRKIENYYDKIRSSKQEKPFHELIIQIGNKDDMAAESENGELAEKILDEYIKGFQERNPNLKVFSAHLHMDEATPHLHIDFVPFTTGSKRGLDTRVSLKQALLSQGFKGTSKGDTEWNRWVQSEKEVLAEIMLQNGIEWDQHGTHREHLSVLDFKKEQREHELEKLETIIGDKKLEHDLLNKRISNYNEALDKLTELEDALQNDEKYQLPEPQGFMTAKAYKTKFAEPIIKELKKLVKSVLARSFEGWENYYRLNQKNGRLYSENQDLIRENNYLKQENAKLQTENKDYRLLKKVLGSNVLGDLIERTKAERDRNRNKGRSR
ncbi:MAG: plasmid recombination protein [Clostridiales bacterium]|nr:plasmid recombination protein [Clostridiales bacterium]